VTVAADQAVAADREALPGKVLVLCLGNPDRGDDGVGALVARNLRGRLPADVQVLARSGDMLSLIEDCAGFDALVCVDAAAPVTAPGRIHRFDLARDSLPRDLSFTSGLAEAIELARALQRAPQTIIVYAVEGGCFDGGTAMTPAVATAAAVVADRVVAEIVRLRQARSVRA
jgi:hydrogenase maturation protease